MKPATTLSIACLLVCAIPSLAHAQPAPETSPPPLLRAPSLERNAFDGPYLAFEGVLGLGTPLGAAGASLIFAPHRDVAFELGAGIGLSGKLQKSFMARLTVARDPGLSFGVGLSEGGFRWTHGSGLFPGITNHWDDARWVNAELSVAREPQHHMQARIFAGYSRQLSPDQGCTKTVVDDGASSSTTGPCTDSSGSWIFYVGGALRFATPL